MTELSDLHPFLIRPQSCFGKPVCRLGLASRGSLRLRPDDVVTAIERGVNFLNWPGGSEGEPEHDAFSRAVASLGSRRESLVVCTQLAARSAAEADRELSSVLKTLRTDYLDVVTLYYVERRQEWQQLLAPEGALGYCQQAKAAGVIRRIGLTSHQRPLAAEMVKSGLLDTLMIRYNAAHRGAETEVFPVTDEMNVPVIAYTALRWKALLRPTPEDPPGFVVPGAADWYRFALQSPSVAVVLAAPNDGTELDEDLAALAATGPLDSQHFDRLAAHGQRVRRHAGAFP
jgi:predicted aldo/keto reductase-like oxidoreductase